MYTVLIAVVSKVILLVSLSNFEKCTLPCARLNPIAQIPWAPSTAQNFILLLSLHQVFRPVVALPTIPTYKRSPFFSLLHCVLAAPSPVYASPHNTHHTLLIWTIGFLLKIVYLMWQERLMKASILYLLACKLYLYKMRVCFENKTFYSFSIEIKSDFH